MTTKTTRTPADEGFAAARADNAATAKTIGTLYNSKATDCATCENARRMFTPGGWIDCPDCRYEIKCDDCKVTIGRTDSIARSAQGGICEACRVA